MPSTQFSTIFQCRMCGACCEGRGGIVVSPADMTRLAAFLALSIENIKKRYCEKNGSKYKIRCGEDGYCVFFRKDEGCSVHAGKPAICRAWPFFRGNLEDPSSLLMAKEFCPGISRTVTHADFVRTGLAYLHENNLVAHNALHEANALILA